jgi:transposase
VPLLPKNRKSARVDDRRILNAIFYVLRTGMPWRDLPERYGPYTTAYNRFNRWSRRGIWQQRSQPFYQPQLCYGFVVFLPPRRHPSTLTLNL